jgi:hypothetical protein
LIKRDQSSFAEGMRGPFREITPDRPETILAEGEYYEHFVLGRNLKAWFWNGKPVCVDISEMAYVIGDGRHTVAELINPNLKYAVRAVSPDLMECMAKYQGREMDSVLQEGEKLYVDYRYGSPLVKYNSRNSNILSKLNSLLTEQLNNAGLVFEQSIPSEIRANTVFSADGVVDEQDRIWFLEINCNPGLHPDVYPPILESLFPDVDVIPDAHKPLHLQRRQVKTTNSGPSEPNPKVFDSVVAAKPMTPTDKSDAVTSGGSAAQLLATGSEVVNRLLSKP